MMKHEENTMKKMQKGNGNGNSKPLPHMCIAILIVFCTKSLWFVGTNETFPGAATLLPMVVKIGWFFKMFFVMLSLNWTWLVLFSHTKIHQFFRTYKYHVGDGFKK